MSGRTAQILLALVVCLVALAGCKEQEYLPNAGYNNGYQPKQPIPFSHKLHAGDNKIPCLYCHTTADKSNHATVPALNVCMNCHRGVAVTSPWIKQLTEAYESGRSIEWKKVHMLPDFVRFNHRRHVNRVDQQTGESKPISCQTCHGQIEEMEVIHQEASLSMGWCVNCHRKPENNAPTNCSTCHY